MYGVSNVKKFGTKQKRQLSARKRKANEEIRPKAERVSNVATPVGLNEGSEEPYSG